MTFVREALAKRGLLADTSACETRLEADEEGVLVRTVREFSAPRLVRERFVDATGWPALVTLDGLEMLAIDELLADLLEELAAPKNAASVRATLAEERGNRWHAESGEVPSACSAVIWYVQLRILAERKEARHKRPALPRAILVDQLLPSMTRQLQLLDDGKVRNETGRVVGVIIVDAQTTHAMVREGVALLGSMTGHRMIHAFVHRAFSAHEAGAGDPRRIAFPGGWSGLADAIGYREPSFEKLQLIARAGQAVEWQTRDLRAGGLWTWSAKRGSRTRGPGEVAFVLGDALLPGLAAAMADGGNARTLSARMARRLVPELRYEPPTGAVRDNEAGAVWTLQRLFVLEMADRADEYFKAGSIAMTPERWRELCDQARVPSSVLDRVLDSWRAGDAEAPALLTEPEPGRFDLAPIHELERGFLAEAGQRRVEGRANAALGRAKKRAGTPSRKRKS